MALDAKPIFRKSDEKAGAPEVFIIHLRFNWQLRNLEAPYVNSAVTQEQG